MASELQSLIDLGCKQGLTHQAVVTEIKQNILRELARLYPTAPISAEVAMDSESGKVRILSQDKDITPKGFDIKAERVARLTVIKMLEKSNAPPTVEKSVPNEKRGNGGAGVFFFWGYHVLYGLYVALFILSITRIWHLSDSTMVWTTPSTWYFLIALITPLLVIGLVMKKGWSRHADKLVSLLLQVEIPILILCGLGVAVASSFLPVIHFVLLTIIIALLLLFGLKQETNLLKTQLYVLFPLTVLVFLTLAYGLFLYSFLVPIAIGMLAQLAFNSLFHNPDVLTTGSSLPVDLLFFLIGIVFRIGVFLLGTILFLAPYSFLLAFGKIGMRLWFQGEAAIGKKQMIYMALGGLVLWIGGVFLSTYQEQVDTRLNELAKIQQFDNYEARREVAENLLPQKNALQTLLQAENQKRYHYPLKNGNDFLALLYHEIYQLPEPVAQGILEAFYWLAFPFVYREPVFLTEAEAGFTYLFGHSYLTQVVDIPVSSNVKEVNRDILVTTEPEAHFATVTYQETLENQTFSDQEVVYEFLLPPLSVVTNLILGPNLEYPGQIAPRGAAQETYQRELRQRRDPALLEMTGPNAYRLRVFPVPPKGAQHSGIQKVSFTYVTPVTGAGIPLPTMLASRNVVTSDQVKLAVQRDNEAIMFEVGASHIPLSAGMINSICQQNQIPTTNISLGITQAQFLESPLLARCSPDFGGMEPVKLRVLIESAALSDTKKPIQELAALTQIPDTLAIEVMQYNDLLGQPLPLSQWQSRQRHSIHFGTLTLPDLKSIAETGNNDTLMVVLGKQKNPKTTAEWLSNSPVPVAVVLTHPLPLSADTLGKLWQKEVVFFGSVNEALRYINVVKPLRNSSAIAGSSSFIKWEDTGVKNEKELQGVLDNLQQLSPATTPFGAVATQAFIQRSLKQLGHNPISNLLLLDALHLLAERAAIVTPYSSLIALVTDQQQTTLDNLSKVYTRFDERMMVEDGSSSMTLPFDTGIPQPPGMKITDLGSGFLSPFGMSTLGPGATIPTAYGGGGGGGTFSFGLGGTLIMINAFILGIGVIVWSVGSIKRRLWH